LSSKRRHASRRMRADTGTAAHDTRFPSALIPQLSALNYHTIGRTQTPDGAPPMSKELLLVVDAVANEKGVPKAVIFDAMEAALASAAKKRYPDEEPDIRVSIDHDTGEYE